MKKRFIATLAFLLTVTISTQVFSALGLEPAGTISADKKLENAPVTTPAENKFTVEGQDFILLDAAGAQTDGFFVMADGLYGTSPVDLTPGISANDSIAKFDASDENNVAYWLNHDFLQNGNGDVRLPGAVADQIVSHQWWTEPCGAEGFTEEYAQECKIALLSDYEYRTYAEKIGHTPSVSGAATYYLRTACALNVGTNLCYGLAVSFRTPGTTVSPKATVAQYIRPVFYLSPSFFDQVRVENIGENVLLAMNEQCDGDRLAQLYTQEELDRYFPKPTAEINKISGGVLEGNTLSVDYAYRYLFPEGETEIAWYSSDSPDGDFEKVFEGERFVLERPYVGKFIQVSVTPVGSRGINPIGDTVFSSFCAGPVLERESVKELLQKLQQAEDMTDILQENNGVFGLDLSLLTEENKFFVFENIRGAVLENISDLTWVYGAALALYQINYCDYEAFAPLLSQILTEEVFFSYMGLSDPVKKAVFERLEAHQDLKSFQVDMRKHMVQGVLELEPMEAVLPALEGADDLFSVNFKEMGQYRLALIGASVAGKQYPDFSALNSAVSQAAERIRGAMVNGEALMGLSAANRTAQTAPLEGALAETPERNLFSYDGKGFIVLDRLASGNKTYLFIMAKDYYGTYPVDTTPGRPEGDAQAKYDMNDPYNIAYWLNHDFLFKGNGGRKLPREMIARMDVTRIWHTEPSNVENYKKEHLDVGPLALLSNYEWRQYIREFGLDTKMTGGGFYFRSARAGAVTATTNQLLAYFGVPGSTLEQNALKEAYIRPVFYLDTDFFAEHKVSGLGDKLAMVLQEALTKEQLEALYTAEEIDRYFKKPEATAVTVQGHPVTGKSLEVTYQYHSAYPEAATQINWLVSDRAEGEYTKAGTGETFLLVPSMAGKYVKAEVIPVSSAKINPVGNGVVCEGVTGPVFSEATLLERINGASEAQIFEVMLEYKAVLDLDLELKELENKERVAQMLAAVKFESIDEIYTAYGQAVLIEKINESDQQKIMEYLMEEGLGIDLARYTALEEKEALASKLAGQNFNRIPGFIRTLYEQMALLEFKKADRTVIKEFLLYYDFLFDENIKAFSDEVLGQAGIKLLKEKPEDFAALNKAVTRAVADAKKGNKPVISPGGGGGSSTGAVPSPPAVTQNPGTKEPEPAASEKPEEKPLFQDMDAVPWAVEIVEDLTRRGILSGMGDGNFKPQEPITREQFVKMIVAAFEIREDEEQEVLFLDVGREAWYESAVAAAIKEGIVKGITADYFGVGLPVSRQDMAVIAARALGLDEAEEAMAFSDYGQIAEYARGSVVKLYALGMINGYEDNTFRPYEKTTRAEAAVVLARLLEQKEDK